MGDPRYGVIDKTEVIRFATEKLPLVLHQELPEYPAFGENATIHFIEHYVVRSTIMQVRSWMHDGHRVVRKEQKQLEFPATPWQFFKQVYAPAWFLKRWPVVMRKETFVTEEHHHHLCPHLVTDDSFKHAMYLYNGKIGIGSELR